MSDGDRSIRAADDADGPRLVVTAGTPDDLELAALVAGLTALSTAAGRASDDGTEVAAWRRAALVEAAGGTRVHAPQDLPSGPRH